MKISVKWAVGPHGNMSSQGRLFDKGRFARRASNRMHALALLQRLGRVAWTTLALTRLQSRGTADILEAMLVSKGSQLRVVIEVMDRSRQVEAGALGQD